jgi:Ring finger domain
MVQDIPQGVHNGKSNVSGSMYKHSLCSMQSRQAAHSPLFYSRLYFQTITPKDITHEPMPSDEFDIEAAHSTADGTDCRRCIRLPTQDSSGHPRLVEGVCHICFCDYEVGDEIVWSALPACHHAYCKKCISSWLNRGKKRCPICRQWFVPAKAIADQRREYEAKFGPIPAIVEEEADSPTNLSATATSYDTNSDLSVSTPDGEPEVDLEAIEEDNVDDNNSVDSSDIPPIPPIITTPPASSPRRLVSQGRR